MRTTDVIRARMLLLLCVTSLLAVSAEDTIEVGWSREQVITMLGKPRSEIGFGNTTKMAYSTGKVKLADGKVESWTVNVAEELDSPRIAAREEVNPDEDRLLLKRIDEIIASRSRRGGWLKVVQILEDGYLCQLGLRGPTGIVQFGDGADTLLVVYGKPKALRGYDDICSARHLYYSGSCTYTDRVGRQLTIPSYSLSRRAARKALMAEIAADAGEGPSTGRPAECTPQLRGCGSGFFVTTDGYAVTNAHVVRGAAEVWLRPGNGVQRKAQVVSVDEANDLALLKVDGKFSSVEMAPHGGAKLGQTVFTVGYPMPDLQGVEPKVTRGIISSLKGAADDVTRYQIDAAIQPGNSGGPLADEEGRIIGVVVASLDAGHVAKTTGSLPQNVNYAVKLPYLTALLAANPGVKYTVEAGDAEPLSFEDAVAKVAAATVLVIVH